MLYTYLEVEVEAFTQIDLLREALVLAHVKRQRIIAVSIFTLRQEDGIVETDELTSGHALSPPPIYNRTERKKQTNQKHVSNANYKSSQSCWTHLQ